MKHDITPSAHKLIVVPACRYLANAVQNLDRAIREIDTSVSFAQAKESIADELQGVQAAREELRTTLSCQPTS